MKTKTAQAQLDEFIDKFSPEVAALGRRVLSRFRRLVPPSIEIVYDNYNFLVVGFSPTERPSDAIFSIPFYARGVSLCFLHGAKLADPHGLLHGGGKQIRSIRLPEIATLDDPRLQELIASAIKASAKPFDAVKKRQLVIKSVSAKQRPRRLPAKKGKKS